MLRQLTSLRLDHVTLILQEGVTLFPALVELSVSNVHVRIASLASPPSTLSPRTPPPPEPTFQLVLPKLTSLEFDYSLAPHLCPPLPPLALADLASSSILSLTIHLLSNPATDGPTAPSPLDPDTSTPVPTLSLFPSVVHLTLLADSSYRTPLYFPLLSTVPDPSPLESFAVLVDMGYRDKELEVREMSCEIASAIREGKGLGKRLERVTLPRLFGRYEQGQGMKELREAAKRGAIAIQYDD